MQADRQNAGGPLRRAGLPAAAHGGPGNPRAALVRPAFRLGAAGQDAILTRQEIEPMKRPTLVLIAMLGLVASLVLAPGAALAQDGAQTSQQDRGSRFGIGVQSSWPAYGLSGIYDANDRMTAQLVLG